MGVEDEVASAEANGSNSGGGGGGNAPVLVVTGPNGGGKTALLKAAGQAALLVAHGCFPPSAAGGRADLFRAIHATVGDGQSLAAGRSALAAHLERLQGAAVAARRLGGGALVLVDEACAATDPGQGAALAQAMLEELADAGATAVVTTHYPALKALHVADPHRFIVAAMVSYSLAEGLVGHSQALDAARRVGTPAGGGTRDGLPFPPSVLRRAEALLEAQRPLLRAMDAVQAARAVEAEAEAAAEAARRELEDAERLAGGWAEEEARAAAAWRQEALVRAHWRLQQAEAAAAAAHDAAVEREALAYRGWTSVTADPASSGGAWPGEWDGLAEFYGGAEDRAGPGRGRAKGGRGGSKAGRR